MSIADLFETGERKQDRSHFRNMVMIAKSDGEVSPEEVVILEKIGHSIGLSDDQLHLIMSKPESIAINPPADRVERFEQIVNLLQIIVADGQIKDSEMNVLERIALEIGYTDIDDVDVESIIALIQRGEDTDVIINELL